MSINLDAFSGRDISNAAALIRVMQSAGIINPDDQLVYLDSYKSQPPGKKKDAVLCPVCGHATQPHGCKARKCLACLHIWKPGWKEIKRFGR